MAAVIEASVTYEAPAVEGAILQRVNDLLSTALAEAGKVLQGAGASPEEMLKATMPFIPLMRLLREVLEVRAGHPPPAQSAPGALEGAPLSPEEIERNYVDRKGKLLYLVRMP